MTKAEQDLLEIMYELNRLYKAFDIMKESNKILQEANDKLLRNIVNLQKENAKLKRTIFEQEYFIESLEEEIQELIQQGKK